MSNRKMEWFVYYHDINAQKIVPFNVFRHAAFLEYVQKHLKKCTERDEFAEKLRKELQYYFWSKSEYELILHPWCGSRNMEEVKIDIYNQVMLNFNIFVDYVWSFKKPKRNRNVKKDGDTQ